MTDFKELFMFCDECNKVTRWAFLQQGGSVSGQCEECEGEEEFDSWDVVMALAEDD